LEYLHVMMPFDDPSKLDEAQKPAVAAYMLVRNGNLAAATSRCPSAAAARRSSDA